MKKLLSALFLTLLLGACGTVRKSEKQNTNRNFTVEYADLFRVERDTAYTLVTLIDPWNTTRTLRRYVLVDRERDLPDELPEGTLLRTPLQRVAVFASVHCSILGQLEATNAVAGVCEPHYIKTDSILAGLSNGRIADLGQAYAPDIERIIGIEPEAIITSPVENIGYGRVEKIGVPLVEGIDYMESTPLGRAEWIRFFGLLFGKEREADSIFRGTEQRYNELRERTKGVTHRPSVLPEKKISAVWYVPGGESYVAHLFRDAGAEYAWKEDNNSGSLALPFETVFERCGDAEFWLLKYNKPTDMTYGDLQNEYAPYQHFEAFRKRNVYGCNTTYVPYYEEAPMHPDRVLADFVWIFHPELMPDYAPRYFQKLSDHE